MYKIVSTQALVFCTVAMSGLSGYLMHFLGKLDSMKNLKKVFCFP